MLEGRATACSNHNDHRCNSTTAAATKWSLPRQRRGWPHNSIASRMGVSTFLRKLMKPALLATLAITLCLPFQVKVHSIISKSLQQQHPLQNQHVLLPPAQQMQMQRQQRNNNNNNNKTTSLRRRSDTLKHGYWTNQSKLLAQVLYNGTCPGALTRLRQDRTLSPSVCTVYIHASPYDRSGAYVFHLLDGHAYSYHWGYRYGGACGTSPHTADTKSLVNWLGLSHALPLEENVVCPEYESPDPTKYYEHVLRSTDLYRRRFLYYKPNWLSFVRQQIHSHLQRTYPNEDRSPSSSTTTTTTTSTTNKKNRTVVVHIRRGDVMPCMLGWGRMRNTRFTPNQHYLNVLDYYAQPGDMVKIYSESLSYEPWDDFIQRGYQLILDGPLVDAWKAMIWDADVLVLSQSSFSYVPALFSRAQLIVYTPQFKSNPQPEWTIVPEHIMSQTMQLRNDMLANCTFELQTIYGNDQNAYMKQRKMYTYPGSTYNNVSKAPLLTRPPRY